MRIRTACLALALFSVGTACAAAPGARPPRSPALLSDRPADNRRECWVAAAPTTLPAADLVVDSTALARALEAVWRRHDLAAGYLIASLEFDQNGWNSRRVAAEHDLDPATADSVLALVFQHRRTVSPGDPWGVRLRIDMAGAPRLRVGRREVCAPRLLDASAIPSLDPSYSVQHRDPPRPTMDRVWVRLLISEAGTVTGAEIEPRPMTQRTEWEVRQAVHSLTFLPATVDGVPVATWFRVAVPVQ